MDEDAKCLDEHLLWSWEKNVRMNDVHAANKPGCREHRIREWEKERASEPACAPIHSPTTKEQPRKPLGGEWPAEAEPG